MKQPATPLPFHFADRTHPDSVSQNHPEIHDCFGRVGLVFGDKRTASKNAAYIVHAANAYPRLVAELEWAVQELGALANQGRASHSSMARGLALLRQLGESK